MPEHTEIVLLDAQRGKSQNCHMRRSFFLTGSVPPAIADILRTICNERLFEKGEFEGPPLKNPLPPRIVGMTMPFSNSF
jgi:hypothetical protein